MKANADAPPAGLTLAVPLAMAGAVPMTGSTPPLQRRLDHALAL